MIETSIYNVHTENPLTLARASCGRVFFAFPLCLVCSARKLLAVSMIASGVLDWMMRSVGNTQIAISQQAQENVKLPVEHHKATESDQHCRLQTAVADLVADMLM